MENINDLYLESPVFDDARAKFNVVLQRLFKSMVGTGSNDASISLKMDVHMNKRIIENNDPDIEGETRNIMLPDFSYEVNSSIQVKDKAKGNNDPQMELVWDDEQKKYVLQYVANTTQRSIFDKDFQDNMNGANDSDGTGQEVSTAGAYQIAGPVANEGTLPGEIADEGALPGEVQDDVHGNGGQMFVDGDYREVDPEADNSGDEDTEDDLGNDWGDGGEDDDYSYEDPEL